MKNTRPRETIPSISPIW